MKNVVVCGCFDFEIHKGHEFFLKRAKSLGDKLYVCISPDRVIIENKNRVPILNQDQRIKLVNNLDYVDYVIKNPNSPEGAIDVIRNISPNIYCFGYDQQKQTSWNLKLIKKLKINNPNIQFYIVPQFQSDKDSTTRELMSLGLI